MSGNGQTAWQIKGEEVGSCNCDWGCPCQFNANPTQGNCHALIGIEIREGQFGDTDLAGVRFAEIVSWPGAIHEGDGTVQLFLDEASSTEQHDAIGKLATGEYGGDYFEIFASVLPHTREPIVASIEIETDRESRVASIRVGDIAESTIGPIKNPVSGEEHRVRIDLPGGFEYQFAELADTVNARTSGEAPLEFTLAGSYAQLNEFDWSNA